MTIGVRVCVENGNQAVLNACLLAQTSLVHLYPLLIALGCDANTSLTVMVL